MSKEDQEVVECEKCHCKGNSSCGHEPLDKEWNCTLKPNGLCPCCDIEEKQKAEQKNICKNCLSEGHYKTCKIECSMATEV